MASSTRDLLSVRTVVVRYPTGDKEYWLTDEVFSVGDEIRGRSGGTLVVEAVLEPSKSGSYTAVKLSDEAA
jgi:hypothetical protein